jgi:hypothetical protein
MTWIRPSLFAALAAATFFTARPALAGPPLLCFPFNIGTARTLPMATTGWHDTDPQYDVSRLVQDTVDLLGTDTPIIVRMETLRRATMYAGPSPAIAAALLAKLEERAGAVGPDAALAVFDFGYLVETYRQAASVFKNALPSVDAIDGYSLVRKAFAFRHDPEIEFASAIIAAWPKRADYETHRRNALAGAKSSSLLAANLATHLQSSGQ